MSVVECEKLKLVIPMLAALGFIDLGCVVDERD